jgi:hypothetical protein
MGVEVDHRHYEALTEMFVDKLEDCGSSLFGGQRIKDDPTGLTFDKADVGQIKSPLLIDPGDHLVQSIIHVHNGLPLQ